MKHNHETITNEKLNSSMQKFLIALMIYICALVIQKPFLYVNTLKIISTILLMGSFLLQILSKKRKEIPFEETLIIFAIILFLLLGRIEESTLSACLFYLKKMSDNQSKNSVVQQNKKGIKKGQIKTLKKGEIIFFDGILKMPKAYFLNEKQQKIVIKNEGEIKAGYQCLTKLSKIEVKRPYKNTEYATFEKKKNELEQTLSKQEENILNLTALLQKIVVFSTIGINLVALSTGNYQASDLPNSILIIVLIFTINPFQMILLLLKNVPLQLLKEQIIVNDKDKLYEICKIKNYLFEKTKTLTVGEFRITEIYSENPEELLYYLNYGLHYTNHPIKRLVEKYQKIEIVEKKIKSYEVHENRGITYKIDGKKIHLGTLVFMKENKIEIEQNLNIGTIIYVAVDKVGIGSIVISDGIKYATKVAIGELKKETNAHLEILSSDNERIVSAIGKELEIKDKYSNLTVEEKKFWIRYIKQKHKGKTALIASSLLDKELYKEVDVTVILIDTLKNVEKYGDIYLLGCDMTKLMSVYYKIKEMRKKKNLYLFSSIVLLLLMAILIGIESLPLWVIIIIWWILEIIKNKLREEI